MRVRLIEFLSALPDSLPDPDIMREDDGMYCVDWILGGPHVFSISVGETGYSFAYTLPNGSNGHGFLKRGEEAELIEHLTRLLP